MTLLESNLYVDRFVPKIQTDLDHLLVLDGEIVRERQNWQNSGAAVGMAELFFQAQGLNSEQVPQKHFLEIVRLKEGLLFGDVTVSKSSKDYAQRLAGQVSRPIIEKLKELSLLEEEHQRNYQKAIKSLMDQKRVIDERVYPQWLSFMDGLRPVGDFAQFLSEDEFRPFREQQRPFLELLSHRLLSANGGRPVNLGDLFGSRIVENAVNQPEQEEFSHFLESLSSKKQSRSDRTTLQWLTLFSFPVEGVDPQKVLEQITASHILPDDLKESFMGYLRGRLSQDLTVITQVLGKYKPPVVNQPTVNLRAKLRQRRNQVQGLHLSMEPSLTVDVSLPSERAVYELALEDSLSSVSGPDLDSYIRKVADGFAAHDERMKKDIAHITQALTEDPFGLGCYKLTDSDYTTPSRKLPLRGFRPDQRPLLTLEHPHSRRLRVVYHTERQDGRHVVRIHEVLNHADFDDRYTGHG